MTWRFDVDDPTRARVAWSRIAEPGDRLAGGLIAAIGPAAALRWLEGAGTGRPIDGLDHLGESPGGLAKARQRWRVRIDQVDPEADLQALTRLGGYLLTPDMAAWPPGLNDLGVAAPFSLWVRGQRAVAADLAGRLTPAVAVVGLRASTAYGESVTANLVAELAGRRVAIVSGGAFGIDAVAHRAALAQDALTVAVMAGGVDRLYPLGNESLLTAVIKHGAVISELPPGAAPRRERFLARNRLIAAMSQLVVVTESAWRSGSHRTARVAAELMRPVAAFPGPVTAASSAGCHRLIREGAAVLVSCGDEVLELLSPLGQGILAEPGAASGPLDGLGPVDRLVLDALPANRGATMTGLVISSGLAVVEVMASLSRLERSGQAVTSNGTWRKARRRQANERHTGERDA